MVLVWSFDLVSPFSYLALPRVEALAREREVTWRPILFGALLAHWGTLGPAEIGPKRLHTYRLCQFLAAQAGIPLRFPPAHPFQPLAALRVVTALDARPEVVRAAFDFIWAEGRDPSEPAELAALCARLGVEDADDLIARTGAKARLRAATEAAVAEGLFGVPTLSVDGELFWGVDAMPLAEAYLADRGLFASGEMARLAALPVGVERRQPPTKV